MDLTARQVDDALGEAGIAVTGLDRPGWLHPRVVVGRVLSCGPVEAMVELPTPERVLLPKAGCHAPLRAGDVVAVALPGAKLFALDPQAGVRRRYGLSSVPAVRGHDAPVGRICTDAELCAGGSPDIRTLPDGTQPGAPLAAGLDLSRREEILHVSVPDHLAHCAGLWGLAQEISRGSASPVPVTDDPSEKAVMELTVACTDRTVAAALTRASTGGVSTTVTDVLRERMLLAGIDPSDPFMANLRAAAFEFGVSMAAVRVPTDTPVRVSLAEAPRPSRPAGMIDVGWPESLEVQIAPTPLTAPSPANVGWLVLAAFPRVASDLARCRAAVERVGMLNAPGAEAPALVGSRAVRGPAGCGRVVMLRLHLVRDVLGTELTAEACIRLLALAGVPACASGTTELAVSVPSTRGALRTESDLIAEIIRVHGYRNLPATVPAASATRASIGRRARLDRARAAVVEHGFQEVVTPAVLAKPAAAHAMLPWYAPALHLLRQGGRGDQTLRRSLVPGLLQAATSQSNRVEGCAVFEAGTVIRPGTARGEWHESLSLALLHVSSPGFPAGNGGRSSGGPALPAADLLAGLPVVAGAVRAAVRAAGIDDASLVVQDDPGFVPGTVAVVTAHGVRLGVIGQLPHSALPVRRAGAMQVMAAELLFSQLLRTPRSHRPVEVPRGYPAVELDVSAVTPSQTPTARLMSVLQAASPLITSVTLRDIYVDHQLPSGNRVLTVRIAVASPWRPVTKQEALAVCDEAMAAAAALGVRRR
ncbi:hypothetical protein [Streptomyces collinus]|uniref:phenylalanine--tRNA ligase subunit beta-related protein n=1 Tax=Streptomyces collinus TaxID=42684 RepID=UPI003688782A